MTQISAHLVLTVRYKWNLSWYVNAIEEINAGDWISISCQPGYNQKHMCCCVDSNSTVTPITVGFHAIWCTSKSPIPPTLACFPSLFVLWSAHRKRSHLLTVSNYRHIRVLISRTLFRVSRVACRSSRMSRSAWWHGPPLERRGLIKVISWFANVVTVSRRQFICFSSEINTWLYTITGIFLVTQFVVS